MSRLIPILRGRGQRYKLLDRFSTARAAGAVNGRLPEPGPGGAVLIRDVENKISIVNGVETWAAQATPAFTDQDRVYANLPITRAFGVIAICKYRLATDSAGHYSLALVTSQIPTWGHTHVEAAFYRNASLSLSAIYNATLGPVVCAIATDTDYLLAIELRAAGAKWYIKGGAFANWTKLFEHTLGSTATLYVASAGYTAVFTFDNIKLPSRKFFDVPLASDSFAGADGSMTGRFTDGLGHAEQNGGGGLAWTTPGNTWSISGGAAVNTPTQGAELLTDGGLENWASATDLTSWTETLVGTSTINREGTIIHGGSFASRSDIDASNNNAFIAQTIVAPVRSWILCSAWVRASVASKLAGIDLTSVSGASQSIGITYGQIIQCSRCISANPSISVSRRGDLSSNSLYVDDVSGKILTLSSLFSSLVLSTVNVTGEWVIKTLIAGTQAGCILRLDDPNNPANFLLLYWDGAGNVKLDECLAGVYTNKLNVVKAYATGDKVVPWVNGSAWRVYHVTAAGVATLLGSGTTSVLTGNWIGDFSTYEGNAIESCNVYAVGAEGQYEGLNLF